LQRELELLRRENALLQREFRWTALNEGDDPTAALRVAVMSTVRTKETSDLLTDFNGDRDRECIEMHLICGKSKLKFCVRHTD